jgi:hypothetical protein
MCNASFNNHIFYATKNLVVIYTVFVEKVTKLHQVPFGGVFLLFDGALVFNEVRSFFIDGIICEMNKSFFQHFGIIGIFLCCESNQTLIKQENFQRFKAGYHNIDSEIILVAVDQMRIRNILADNIIFFVIDLSFRANDSNSLTTGTGCGFHNIHMFVV